MNQGPLIPIGKIVNTQGHRGEVKVIPLTDWPERFEELDRVFVGEGENVRSLHVEGVRYHKHLVILRFREIKTMDEGETLKNQFVKIPEGELRVLPPDQYYIYQLIGLQVQTEEGEALGELVDVFATGSNDVYVVKDSWGRELLIPALKEVVRHVDLQNKVMEVRLLEGLRGGEKE